LVTTCIPRRRVENRIECIYVQSVITWQVVSFLCHHLISASEIWGNVLGIEPPIAAGHVPEDETYTRNALS